MTNAAQFNTTQVRPEDKALVEALVLEAMNFGHSTLTIQVADGKLVSGSIEKKFKIR